jgi:hypothetical protein
MWLHLTSEPPPQMVTAGGNRVSAVRNLLYGHNPVSIRFEREQSACSTWLVGARRLELYDERLSPSSFADAEPNVRMPCLSMVDSEDGPGVKALDRWTAPHKRAM